MANITNGTVSVVVTGGVGPYQYTLLNAGNMLPVPSNAYPTFTNPVSSVLANTFTFGNASDITGNSGLQAGSYKVKIVDANGCETFSDTLVVSDASPAPTATPVATPVPPTATPVLPTSTPEPTATEVPPTATPEPTTVLPTATPEPTTVPPTATPVPPTATPEPTGITGLQFHLGIEGFPYAQDLIGGTLYKSDSSVAADFPDLLGDMLANPGAYEPVNTVPSWIPGNTTFTMAASAGANFYWLVIPTSANAPDLTTNAKISIDGAPDDIASAKLDFNFEGNQYILYKLNTVPTTSSINIAYN